MRNKTVISFGVAVAIIVLVFTTPFNAEPTRLNDIYWNLSFSNGEAICEFEICTDISNNWISATMELWKGNARLSSWNASGYESVSMEESRIVTPYSTYRLEVHYTINGVAQPSLEASRYYG